MTTTIPQSKDDIAQTLGTGGSSVRKQRVKRLAIWGGGGIVIASAIVLLVRMKPKTDPVQYVTQPARRGNLVVTVSATGTLQPIKKVDVGIEVSGTIKTVAVDYNDPVTNGQLLAQLDTAKLESQALQSEASLASARATVREAEAQLARLNRVRELSGGKMPSQSDLDTAEASLARAKAAITQWQATLAVNHTDISKAVVHSPINGVVLARSIEPGQTVVAAMTTPTLFTLAEDLKQMELQVDVDEADVGKVQPGQAATFTVDAYPDKAFPARISQVRYGSQTVEGVVTYKTVLTVDNSKLLLRPGMTATAVITVERKDNVLLVPSATLRFVPLQPESTGKSNGGGGLVGALLPHPPQSESTQRDEISDKSKDQRVWTLRNGQLNAIPFVKGSTDGSMTEVASGSINSGMELVTDMVTIKK